MSQPLVSVVIPTYNRPDALAELLECLIGQNQPGLEVIVVNDFGADVRPVCALYPELDLVVIDQPENQGHVVARNAGARLARGRFIMLCDDDDLVLPGHLDRMLAEIEGHDLVYSDTEIVQFRHRGRTRCPGERFLFAYRFSPDLLRMTNTFFSSGSLYRRELHDRIGWFDEEIFHYWDWDFILRATGAGRVKRVPVASTLYAFAPAGDNMSGAHGQMRPYLDRLSAKHGLGELPTMNFFLMLEQPMLKAHQAPSKRVWDGEPIISRWARQTR